MLRFCFAGLPVAFTVLLFAGGSYPLLLVYAVLLGFFYGGLVALMGAVSAHLFGVRGLGPVMGSVFLGAAVGTLLLPPLVGWLADTTGNNTVPQLAIVIVSAAGFLSLLRLDPDPVPAEELVDTPVPA